MSKPLLLVAVLALACAQARAEQLLVVGKVVASKAVRTGTPECPSRTGSYTDAEGKTFISISNACGCETVELAIDETLLGSAPGPTASFTTSIGEWCKLNVTELGRPVLAYASGDTVEWAFLTNESEDPLFKRGRMAERIGLARDSLPEKGKGLASLNDLRAALARKRN